MIAKSRPALAALSAAFSHREVKKTYLAIVCGRCVPRASIGCIHPGRCCFRKAWLIPWCSPVFRTHIH